MIDACHIQRRFLTDQNTINRGKIAKMKAEKPKAGKPTDISAEILVSRTLIKGRSSAIAQHTQEIRTDAELTEDFTCTPIAIPPLPR
jgi:hypothetical protein